MSQLMKLWEEKKLKGCETMHKPTKKGRRKKKCYKRSIENLERNKLLLMLLINMMENGKCWAKISLWMNFFIYFVVFCISHDFFFFFHFFLSCSGFPSLWLLETQPERLLCSSIITILEKIYYNILISWISNISNIQLFGFQTR